MERCKVGRGGSVGMELRRRCDWDASEKIEMNSVLLLVVKPATAVVQRAHTQGRPADTAAAKLVAYTVRIEGHTDSKGNAPYNQKLSERRAESVRKWLVEREGLTATQFATQGFGATRPKVLNTKPDGSDDPDGRQINRRVEIVFSTR